MPFGDDMFKTFPGSNHPWELERQEVKESNVPVATRYNAHWSDEEIVAVMFAQPPTTNDDIARLLSREPSGIHAIKTFIRKAILKPDQFRKDGIIKSRYGIVRRIYRILDEHGVRDWPPENQRSLAELLPGTRQTHSRAARYLAKNHSGEEKIPSN